jgi:acetyltransferase-like isoleucine patch superfamily enzyme
MILKLIALFTRNRNKIYSRAIKNEITAAKQGIFHIEYPSRIIGSKYITIGKNFISLSGLRIEAHDFFNGDNFQPTIQIGDNVLMNFDCHIGCINKVVIGNNVLFASRVFITDHFHGHINASELDTSPMSRPLYSKGPVIIEDNVWIGQGVTIMPNVRIGRNCVIGANSVVTKSFQANSILAGNPARVIKTLE